MRVVKISPRLYFLYQNFFRIHLRVISLDDFPSLLQFC
jgi:hypothetical protein